MLLRAQSMILSFKQMADSTGAALEKLGGTYASNAREG
jgi:hypothetical protein